MSPIGLREMICAKCGKLFIPAVYHKYRDEKLKEWYCSYTCHQHRYEKDFMKERKKDE